MIVTIGKTRYHAERAVAELVESLRAQLAAAQEAERTQFERDGLRVLELQAQLTTIAAVVNEQASDDGLWFIAEHATEAYLQAALRRLHAVIEGKDL